MPDSKDVHGIIRYAVDQDVWFSRNYRLSRSMNAAHSPGVGHLADPPLRIQDSPADGDGSSGRFALNVFDDFLEMG